MPSPFHPIDFGRIQTKSVRRRSHKSDVARAARLPEPGAPASELLDSFPDFLGARSFRQVVDAVVAAVRNDRPVVAAFGAHVLKVGCGPILVDLIRRGVIRALCCNGACAIHDVELALLGETSEEVSDTIRDGSFGMVEETQRFFEEAVGQCAPNLGLGEGVGRAILQRSAPFVQQSVFAAAFQAGVPVCVHVALGTDTIHAAPKLDAAALGAASMRDFRLICGVVAELGAKPGNDSGGVWLNIGSAVLLPEVFLKAVSVARNLGANLDAMITANFDMIRHYRPYQNVVMRPVLPGHGHEVIGQHEILLPLLRQAVIEQLAARKQPTDPP